jgi:sterol desaturase/sphingolipid hydroxylase (fatty acid hydroxylase superfamily)
MMISELLPYEPAFRAGVFLLVLSGMLVWEVLAVRRPQRIPRSSRWPGNFAVVLLDTISVRLVLPLTAIGVASIASDHGWGLLNEVELPIYLSVPLAVLLMDMAIYFQHRLFHALPWLWRLHRMHHADLEFDVSTGLRFHPIEIILSMAIKMLVVLLIGAPAMAVIVFDILVSATSLFNHGNVRLPQKLDRWLRFIVVTPDMHRVHHSIITRETDSNFGFCMPWWDRWFGTYTDQPEKGHLGMTIGIEYFRTEHDLGLRQMLIQPFRQSVHDSAPSKPKHSTEVL